MHKTCYLFIFLTLLFLSGCYGGELSAPFIEASPESSTSVVGLPKAVAPSGTSEATHLANSSSQVNQTPSIPTRSASPTHSATPSPLPSLSPSHTPISLPTPQFTKQALIMLGNTGGDGGSPYLDYLGRGIPSFVLYSDGQILIREGDFGYYEDRSGYIFKQASLTPDEICSLFRAISDTGFFKVEANGFRHSDDPIYDFDSSVELSDGGPSYFIIVNGPNPKIVYIYYSYLAYVINEIGATYDLLNNYQLREEALYHPDKVILWIDMGDDENTQMSQAWPDNLPPLSELITAMDYDNYKGVLIQENIESLLQLFDYRIKQLSFKEGEKVYVVTARPLLPHEPIDFLWRAEGTSEFALPFKCND